MYIKIIVSGVCSYRFVHYKINSSPDIKKEMSDAKSNQTPSPAPNIGVVSLQSVHKSRRSAHSKTAQQQNHHKQAALFVDVHIEGDEQVVQQYARTVRRVRSKPMGRYKHWSIDNLNTQCELVRDIQLVSADTVVRTPFSEYLVDAKVLVLDMIGQRVGRLYATDGKPKTTVLHEDSCIAEVFDISYHKPTQSFRMRVVPFKPKVETGSRTRKNVLATEDATNPLFGSWMHLFMESGVTIHGKVVFSDERVIELMVKDTSQQKEWCVLKQGVSKSKFERPSVTIHRLTQDISEDGQFVWKHSQTEVEDDSVDRMNYTTETSPQHTRSVLGRFLERVAPNGVSHLKMLWTTDATHDTGRTQHTGDVSEHVSLTQHPGGVTIDGTKRVVQTKYPFSVTEQFRSLQKSKYVSIGLQLTEECYQSFLYEHISVATGDEYVATANASAATTNLVLLPTTQELVYAQSLSSDNVGIRHQVQITLRVDTQTEAEHLLRCVAFCQLAQRSVERQRGWPTFQAPLQFVDTTEEEFYATPPTKVLLKLNESDANTLMEHLLGQVHMEYDRDEFLQTPEMVASSRVVANHLGKMSQSFVYHRLHYSPMWGASSSEYTMLHFRPMVSIQEARSHLPVPLLHNVSYTTQKTVLLPLNREVYFPQPDDESSDEVINFQSVQRALPSMEQNKNISQKILSKKLSGTRALYDMEQSFEPQWFNVQSEKKCADPIHILNTHFLEHSNMPEHFVLKKNVHFALCDSLAHVHRLHYDKKPSEDRTHVEEALDAHHPVSISPKEAESSMNTFGASFSNQARLSQLSHVLYGATHAYPRASMRMYQTKHTRQYRHIEGHSYDSLNLNGVISVPRWSAHTPSFDPKAFQFTIEVGGKSVHIQPAQQPDLDLDLNHGTRPLNVSSACRMLRSLLNAHTKQPFEVHYVTRTNVLVIDTTAAAFHIVESGGLSQYGIQNKESAYNVLLQKHVVTYVLTPTFAMYEPNTVLQSYLPQFAVLFDYSVVENDDASVSDADDYSEMDSDDQPVRREASTIKYEILEDPRDNTPFDKPSDNKLSIREGRDGRTKYVSLPLQVCSQSVFAMEDASILLVTATSCVRMRVTVNDPSHPHQQIVDTHPFQTLAQRDEHITHSALDQKGDTLHLQTNGNKQYAYSLQNKTLVERTDAIWFRHSRTNTQCDSYTYHHTSNSILEACVYRASSDGATRISIHQNSGVSSTPLVSAVEHPASQLTICCCVSHTAKGLHLHILDDTHIVHAYTWVQDTTTTQLRFEKQVVYRTIRIASKETNLHTQWNAIRVTDDWVYVGDTFGTVHRFGREDTYAYPDASVECVSQSEDTRWFWKRLQQQPLRALRVVLRSTEQLENVTLSGSPFSDALQTSIRSWFANVFLETKLFAYVFRTVPLQRNIPLSNYLLQNVVGLDRGKHSPELRFCMQQSAHQKDCVYDAHSMCKMYVGGSAEYAALPASSSREFATEEESFSDALSDKLLVVAPVQASEQALDDPPVPPVRGSNRLPIKARNTLFYFKMSRLLKSKQGGEYVKQQYAERPVFRHQFHKCKGHCYYKLLYKCKLLRVNGGRFSSKKWTDAIRDTFTTLHAGDVNHICNRCGDSVCPQDAGLRKEFGAFGMSTTHSEMESDDSPHTSSTSNTPPAELTFTQRDCLQKVTELIADKQLSVYSNLLFALPVTNGMRVFLKSFKLAENMKTIYAFILQVSYNEKVVLKVISCALGAIKEKIDTLMQLDRKIMIPRKQNEAELVRSFLPHIQLTRENVTRGIMPRSDFRPKLNTHTSPLSTPELQRVFRLVNERKMHIHNMFDWTTFQNTSELYERNDVYLCVNKLVVDATSYTTLSEMILPQLQFNTRPKTVSDRVCVAKAFATVSRNIYVGGKYPLHIHGTHHTQQQPEKQMQIQLQSGRTLADNLRRQVIYKHVRPSQMKSHYPHVLQTVLQQQQIGEHDYVKQLQCLLGIVQKQKARLSTNPAMFTYLPWVQYYNQLDGGKGNEKIAQLMKTMQFRFESEFEKNVTHGSYAKFVEQ
jgi:hypothetical protein